MTTRHGSARHPAVALGLGAALALSTAATARAQTSSDLPVTHPGEMRESNPGALLQPGMGQGYGNGQGGYTGSSAAYIPGLPPATAGQIVDQARQGAAGGTTGVSVSTGAAGGRTGAAALAPLGSGIGRGSAVLEEYGGGAEEPTRPVGPPSNFHIVRPGDTLWSISQMSFGTPMYWPKLWAMNPQVTNPHWLFPGGSIRIAQGGPAAPAPAPAAEAPLPAPPMAPTGIVLQQNGFVEQGELDAAATIVGSPEEKTMLATNDQAYVSTPEGKPALPVGDRYSIYKVVRKVRQPESGEVLGAIVEVVGDARVLPRGTDRIGRALITESINPVERGQRIGPLVRQFKMVEPRDNKADVDGVVCDTLHPSELVGSEMLVFIDRGSNQGLEVGNHFSVVRRGDGYAPMLYRGPIDDRRYPREVIGDVLVVDVRKSVSTGIVTRSTKEIRIGDHLEARAAR